MMTGFPLLDLRLEFETTRRIEFPKFAGSTLRGCFGDALRKLACITGESTCAGCPLISRCAYTQIFKFPVPENLGGRQRYKDVPNPYVVVADKIPRHLAAGVTFTFGFRLIGNAQLLVATTIEAWRRALEENVGPRKGAASLRRVFQLSQGNQLLLWEDNKMTQNVTPDEVSMKLPAASSVTLEFKTPLRLQDNRKILGPEELDEQRLLMALVRRIYLLTACHTKIGLVPDFAALKESASQITGKRDLTWQALKRISNHNPKKPGTGPIRYADDPGIPISGVVGRWTLRGQLDPFLPYLALGSLVRVGKFATCGLGAYQLTYGGSG